MLLEKEVSKASIAKIVDIPRTALHHFIRTRKLEPTGSKGPIAGAASLEHIFTAIWSLPYVIPRSKRSRSITR
jgi:hypothetical protein